MHNAAQIENSILPALKRERDYALAKGKPTGDIDAEIARYNKIAGLEPVKTTLRKPAEKRAR